MVSPPQTCRAFSTLLRASSHILRAKRTVMFMSLKRGFARETKFAYDAVSDKPVNLFQVFLVFALKNILMINALP
jgi:hypothetical protein